ncbi:MAG: DUF429 domain-containing protein, partial [Limnohabitans sp.]
MPELSDVCLLGCDFSSSPSKRKPIVVALGAMHRGNVQLTQLRQFETLSSLQEFLHQPAPTGQTCVGGFDLPFGLPREWVEAVHWPSTWPECMD